MRIRRAQAIKLVFTILLLASICVLAACRGHEAVPLDTATALAPTHTAQPTPDIPSPPPPSPPPTSVLLPTAPLPPTPYLIPTVVPTFTPVPTTPPTPVPSPLPVPDPTPTPAIHYVEGWAYLSNVASLEFHHPLMASDIKTAHWVADGLTTDFESKGAQSLINMVLWADIDRATLQHILRSPFLEEVTPPDVWALHELRYFGVHEWPYFQQLMAHPMITEGITDRTARLLGALYVLDYDRDLRPLNEGTFILTHEVNLKASGQTYLTVLRVGTTPSDTTMSRLKQTMYGLDALLGLPLPTNNILLVVSDRAVRL